MLSFLVLTIALQAGYTQDFSVRAGHAAKVQAQELPYQGPQAAISGAQASVTSYQDWYFEKPVWSQRTEATLTAFDTVFASMSMNTISLKSEGVFFSPVNVEYVAGFGLKAFGLTVGLEHICTHPSLSYPGTQPVTMDLSRGGTTTYIRYEGKFHL